MRLGHVRVQTLQPFERRVHGSLLPLRPGVGILQPVRLALGNAQVSLQLFLLIRRVRQLRSCLLRLCDVSQGAPMGILLRFGLGQARLDDDSLILQLLTLRHPFVHGALVLLRGAVGFMADPVGIRGRNGLLAFRQPLPGRGQRPLLFGDRLLLYPRQVLQVKQPFPFRRHHLSVGFGCGQLGLRGAQFGLCVGDAAAQIAGFGHYGWQSGQFLFESADFERLFILALFEQVERLE